MAHAAMNDCPSPRAEFWQVLAQALLVPRGPVFFAAMREDLADDLDELANELRLDLGRALNDLSAATLALPDEQALLVAYSRLFLTPPLPCPLALGWHLDGTLLGPSERTLRELMARHGVAQLERFAESADVLPTVLEFVAWLFQRLDASRDAAQRAAFERDIEVLRTHYLGHAIHRMARLAQQGEDEHELPPVYSALLRLIDAAVEDPLERFFVRLDAGEKKARPGVVEHAGAGDPVCCRSCGKPIATARELRVVIDHLRQAGLPADHLALCPDCRHVDIGWVAPRLRDQAVATARAAST